MSFRPVNLTGNKPEKENRKVDTFQKSDRKVVSAENFDEKISADKGLISRWCYCAKINQFTGETERPILEVVGNEFIHIENG